jgi:hypothetical protein
MRRACSRVVVGASLRKAWQLGRPWPARAPLSPQAPQPQAQSAQARARGPARRRSPICLSQDDLVALDDDGNVYQYNFKRSRPRKPRRPSADVRNSLSKTISRLGLLAIPLVLVNQDLSRDDARFGRPPRDDCRRERLALENRLIALRTGPMLTHVLPLRNQPILLPPRGRSVGVEETRRVEMDRGAAMLEKAPLSPIPQRRNGRLESVRLAQQHESISESRLKPR